MLTFSRVTRIFKRVTFFFLSAFIFIKNVRKYTMFFEQFIYIFDYASATSKSSDKNIGPSINAATTKSYIYILCCSAATSKL